MLKINDRVLFVNPEGQSTPATVVGIATNSGVADLVVDGTDRQTSGVPMMPQAGFWVPLPAGMHANRMSGSVPQSKPPARMSGSALVPRRRVP